MAVLEVLGAATGYARAPVLSGLDLTLSSGEILAIAGPNGAGKSTLLQMLSGVLPCWKGSIVLDGADITREGAEERIRAGIVLCPEGRRIFGSLTVEENLLIGATTLWRTLSRHDARRAIQTGLDLAFEIFPILKERRAGSGEALSGGQQQMLAIARALMARPSVLLLDEPSLGLAPQIAAEVYGRFERLQSEGLALVLVEESAIQATKLADSALILVNGQVVLEGPAREVAEHPQLGEIYLGAGKGKE